MDESKTVAAAISGVIEYLKTEKELGQPSCDDTAPRPLWQNAWGLSGRQSQMQMRTLVVMKTFHRD